MSAGATSEPRSLWSASRLSRASGTGLARVVLGGVLFAVGVPVLVSRLGAERYGVWVLITTVTGWLQFADFGMRTAVIRLVAGGMVGLSDEAVDRDEALRHATLLYFVVAVVLIAAAVPVAALVVQTVFRVPRELVADSIWVLSCGVAAFAVDVVSVGLFRGLLDGSGLVDRANLFQMTHMSARWFAYMVAGLLSGSLRVMGSALVLASVVFFVVWMRAARGLLPSGDLRAIIREPDWSLVRRILGFSGVVQANDSLTAAVPQIVEALVVRRYGLSALAVFDIGIQLAIHVRTAIGAVLYPLMPMLSNVHVRDRNASAATAGIVFRLAACVVAVLGIAWLAAGRVFLLVWLPAAVRGSVRLVELLVLGGLLFAVPLPAFYYWNAEGRPWKTTAVLVVYATCFIGGTGVLKTESLLPVATLGALAGMLATVIAGVLISVTSRCSVGVLLDAAIAVGLTAVAAWVSDEAGIQVLLMVGAVFYLLVRTRSLLEEVRFGGTLEKLFR